MYIEFNDCIYRLTWKQNNNNNKKLFSQKNLHCMISCLSLKWKLNWIWKTYYFVFILLLLNISYFLFFCSLSCIYRIDCDYQLSSVVSSENVVTVSVFTNKKNFNDSIKAVDIKLSQAYKLAMISLHTLWNKVEMFCEVSLIAYKWRFVRPFLFSNLMLTGFMKII